MDLAPVCERIAQLGLERQFDIRPVRQSDQEAADLFELADTFLFPYRQIDASGVYYLAKPLGRWMIASHVGIFAEDMRDGSDGELVAQQDVKALAAAMQRAIEERPRGAGNRADESWASIGAATRQLYESAVRGRGVETTIALAEEPKGQ